MRRTPSVSLLTADRCLACRARRPGLEFERLRVQHRPVAEGTRDVMRRYFAALGTDDFPGVVDPRVTWTVQDTGAVVTGADEVRRHLDRLHGAMVDIRNGPLVVGEDSAVLEGDCALPGHGDRRFAYCVVYAVTGGRVSAMRFYGEVESMLAPSGGSGPNRR